MHALMIPFFMLMVHNTVDFSQFGASENYVNILNRVITDYVEVLEDHNNLRLVNKTGEMGQKIHKIGLQFESYEHFSLDNARTMMIGLVDSLLDAINRSQRLRPFIPHCGFTPHHIEIRVNFVDTSTYSYPDFDEIKNMTYSDGVITYSVIAPNCLGERVMSRLRDEPLDFARRASPPLSQFIPPKCRPVF